MSRVIVAVIVIRPSRRFDKRILHAYTCMVATEVRGSTASPCLCDALRQASRAVSRLYDEELRDVVLRTTQFSLLDHLRDAGEIRQRDLGVLTSLDQTTLTRNLRPLIDAGWVAVTTGADRREKLVHVTEAGAAKLEEARPAWERAQARMRSRLPEATWSDLLATLPNVASLAGEA
jgi:DNA-binding MarR family transcriptional regulator